VFKHKRDTGGVLLLIHPWVCVSPCNWSQGTSLTASVGISPGPGDEQLNGLISTHLKVSRIVQANFPNFFLVVIRAFQAKQMYEEHKMTALKILHGTGDIFKDQVLMS
jgi:hypothetical protein